MRSRVPGSRVKLWLLLMADRWIVAAAILASVFVGLLTIVVLDVVPLQEAIASSDPVETLFQAMATAIITGVTLVVSINSLVLSQELGAVGDQRDRMEGSLTFRDDVAGYIDEPVSPPEPSAFLITLLDLTIERAEDFQAAFDGTAELADEVDEYVDELVENAESVSDDLEGRRFGTFGVLSAALNFNYSLKIYEGKRLRRTHADEIDEAAEEALTDVLTALEHFGPAREHVKTLYFQWELVDLSRMMLYSAVPALIVSIGAILTLDNPGSVPGSTLGVANVTWVVLGATTVAVAPFTILTSYILRIATVAKRTLAIGPFILRTTGRSSGPGDHDDG